MDILISQMIDFIDKGVRGDRLSIAIGVMGAESCHSACWVLVDIADHDPDEYFRPYIIINNSPPGGRSHSVRKLLEVLGDENQLFVLRARNPGPDMTRGDAELVVTFRDDVSQSQRLELARDVQKTWKNRGEIRFRA